MHRRIVFFIIFILLNSIAIAQRVKDLATISGIRDNQLIGYGLVVGLDGTGDSNNFTLQTFKTMLNKLGVMLPPGESVSSKNIAAVTVSAQLPPFAQPGQALDVTVSSIGSAKSLRGGTLLLTELKGADGKVYAISQGNLVVGGFGAEGSDGSKIRVNVTVVGRIPNGATVEMASPSKFHTNSNQITYLLHRPDFTSSMRLADAVNSVMGNDTAMPIDGTAISVKVPSDYGQKVRFLSVLENITLEPGEESAKIIVNSRTGTIVIGKNVMVGPAVVTHGSLSVTIKEKQEVSQPLPGTNGATTVTQDSNIAVNEVNSKIFKIEKSVSLDNIVKAINQAGAAPGDLMAILEALKQAGALSADVEII